ncbi:MAG: ABC transporter permease [Xanthobacteraceae bacterium]|jgi:ABC-type antimicrobial peptide transport system permease subunit
MARPFIHWRYVSSELAYRWKRSALLIAGIALAVTLVTTLDMLGRAFADLATVPFRNLGADLIVQRSATQAAVPKEMGIILPYSAEPITADELHRLAAEPGVTGAAGFVLLWNLGKGRFISISGIPLTPDAPALGPGKVRDWLISGRLPTPSAREVVVERHYGAFYRLAPGSTVDIGGEQFTVVGVVDIQQGSQIVASNFYMDINEARRLAGLPPDLVNQVFLKLADMAQTETVKNHIAAWLSHASVTSPGTMLQLFGGVSQTIGRFRSVAVVAGALAALALGATFVFGNLVERSRELAILRVIGWEQKQVRREIAAEMALQGLIAGLLALGLLAIGGDLLAHISVILPTNLPGENPATFAAGGFQAGASRIALPVSLTVWDWLSGPITAILALGICGWWMAADPKTQTLWSAIKGA